MNPRTLGADCGSEQEDVCVLLLKKNTEKNEKKITSISTYAAARNEETIVKTRS